MNDLNNKERLELSALTVDGWEYVQRPIGRPEDTLRMIEEELRILGAIDDPAARDLEPRYGALAARIRLSLRG